MAFPDVVRGLGHIPEAPDETDVDDWREYAESLGPEPETPAPARTETVQWSPAIAAPELDERAPVRPDWEAVDEARQAQDPDPVTAEDPEARPVGDENLKRIMAAYGDLPFGPDRGTRLALFSAIVGRPLESTKDLERLEGYRLYGALHDLKTGRTIATDDGHGNFTIHAGAEPDDEE